MQKRLVVLLVTLVGVAFFAVGAQAAPTGQTASSRTTVAVAAGDKRFTTLVALVKRAGLVSTLNAKGPFTVFAPTNAAFTKLKQSSPDTLEAVTIDKALLKAVLTYHVLGKRVPGMTAIAAAKRNASVKTVQGESTRSSYQALPRGRQADAQRLLEGDRRGRQGVERRRPRNRRSSRSAERGVTASNGPPRHGRSAPGRLRHDRLRRGR